MPCETKEDPLTTRLEIRRLEQPRGLAISGELDLSTVAPLSEALSDLIEDGPSKDDLVLDLAGLTFMDSTGLRTLLDAAERLTGERALILRGTRDPVRRVIEIAGIQRVAENLVIEE